MPAWDNRRRERLDQGAMRITFITDIMTPYMAPVFDAMASRCDLTVLFGSKTGSRAMAWSLATPSFRHRVIGGPVIRRSVDAADIYPNPRVLLELRRARPDVVISAGFSFPSLYAAAYCCTSRARLLVQSDGTSRSEASIGLDQRLTRTVLARAAHGAVGNSYLAAQRLAELGFEPVFEAPHSTDIEPFLEVGRARVARADDLIRVVTVGRLLARKGVDLLVRAVSSARTQGVGVGLMIVGEGDEEPRLRALIGELSLTDVEWHGFVEHGDLPAELARADVFAFPTLLDPFGIVLLEAAATGLPLVVSPHAGAARDLVEDAETGFVVDPRDTAAFARALISLARDAGLRRRMGRAAHELAAGRTPENTADAYLRAATEVALG
ncbi:MAG TPA: glycosyltransferase family 4 protein [Thermoleophilaceae bacterium]